MHASTPYACVGNGPIYWKITSTVTVVCYMRWKFSFYFNGAHIILQPPSLQDVDRTGRVKSSGTSPCIRCVSWYKISTWAIRDESSLGRSHRTAVFACALPATMLLSHWAAQQCLYWLGEILLNPITPILSTKTGHCAADGGWRFF